MKLKASVGATIRERSMVLKTIFRVCIALTISFMLAIVCIVFTPKVFTSSLETTLVLLPKNQFLEYNILTKSELLTEYQLTEVHESDESNFKQLRKELPNSRDDSVFFARMFVMQDYPLRCQYTLVGMHRTLDVAWQVTGLRCGSRKSCKEALELQICRDKKEPQHERHH
ncbi:hypothetical protein [Vibrio algarum]|uniref:Uncharacterized protein n=1 Tax=Vibrio algarum TaxID=3020714 RepID=A0ABT4YRU0_9VIBR|nr:hypothetical protein [Vibrio sp. KJ40-1]MDB1124272.1 hypothetical protein [Vibrio sp. KJ40-1]